MFVKGHKVYYTFETSCVCGWNLSCRCMEKARRKNSKVEEHNLDELNYNKMICIRIPKLKSDNKDFIYK